MTVADYIVKTLSKLIIHVFILSGGGCIYLIDSLGRSKLKYVCMQHEQAAVFAAEGYARLKNTIGVAIVTTGPGSTNAVTGVYSAWCDSIPLLVISGQVKREMIKNKQRQLGDQEADIISIVKSITKYAYELKDAKEIKEELSKAIKVATSGRKGPVWLSIPLDIQGTKYV